MFGENEHANGVGGAVGQVQPGRIEALGMKVLTRSKASPSSIVSVPRLPYQADLVAGTRAEVASS